MPPAPPRRLTIADLVILIVGFAVALQWTRMIHGPRPIPAGMAGPVFIDLPRGYTLAISSAPFLFTTAVALLVARAINPRPRPRLGLLCRQPGFLACLALAVHFPIAGALKGGSLLVKTLTGKPDLEYLNLGEILGTLMVGSNELVPAAWATLAVVGRWRPVPDWIDRAGRGLGVVAILLIVIVGILD